MLQIPELLAPAGDLERLRYAINYGADAVYCSLPEFGMRSAPANFTPEQLTEGVIYAHARGRKVYLTMNTLPTNEEADRLPDAIKEAAKAGVDAFIVADLGVLDACKTVAPDIDVHMSTQTGITNWAAARAAYNLGAKRVVLAREMSLQDIAILRDKTPPELEIEAFVHGAMCMSVSGRLKLAVQKKLSLVLLMVYCPVQLWKESKRAHSKRLFCSIPFRCRKTATAQRLLSFQLLLYLQRQSKESIRTNRFPRCLFNFDKKTRAGKFTCPFFW